MEYYTAERKKELLPFTIPWMELESIMYAKWSKPSGERQILYDLTYKWNLINQTNWQAKYSQRHWNWQQIDSNQRRGERGTAGEKKGKGHQGTYIKPINQTQVG